MKAWQLSFLVILVQLTRSRAFHNTQRLAQRRHDASHVGAFLSREYSLPRSGMPLHSSLSSFSDSSGGFKGSKQLRKKTLTTFQRYLEIECWKRVEVRELEPVLQSVSEACKQINRIVQRAQTDDVYGVALDASGNPLEENVQGEVQQKLDVLCNAIMLKAFCGSSRVIHSVATEEEDEPRCCADIMVRMSAFTVGIKTSD